MKLYPGLDIEVEMDRVVIEHQIVQRPVRICRSDWLYYWEAVRTQLADVVQD